MNTLPQPPPDLPDPEPGDEALRSRRTMRRILSLGTFSIVFLVLFFLAQQLSRPNRLCGPLGKALANIQQIGIVLDEFDAEYGSFPNKVTAIDVKEKTGTSLTLGDGSSNQLFRQLLATGLKSEYPFWPGISARRKTSDDIFNSDATALEPGECEFAYVAGLSAASNSGAPLVMTPLIPGTTTFDPKVFNGEAVIFFVDGPWEIMRIDRSGRVKVDGMDIFDPRQPFWHGKKPDLKWPE